jgi:hypothetical protein
MSVQHIKKFLNLVLQEKLNMTEDELDSFWKKASSEKSSHVCTYEFTKGKRKGELCSSKCKSGSTYCLKHFKVKNDSKSVKNDSKSDKNDSKSVKNESDSDENDSKSDKNESDSDENNSKSDKNDSDENDSKSVKNESDSDENDSKSDKNESDSDENDSKSDKNDSKSVKNESDSDENDFDSDTKKKLNTSIRKCVYVNDNDIKCSQKVYEKSVSKRYCYKHRKHDKSE